MATRTQVLLEDDSDGGPADRTVSFALNGANYEIDLSDRNVQRFDQALEPFRSKARRVGGRPSSTGQHKSSTTKNRTETMRAMRAWAKDNGHQISDRGRISATVVEAYRSAAS